MNKARRLLGTIFVTTLLILIGIAASLTTALQRRMTLPPEPMTASVGDS